MMALKWATADFFAVSAKQAAEAAIADNAHPPLTGYFFPGVFLEFPYANRDRSFFARGCTPG